LARSAWYLVNWREFSTLTPGRERHAVLEAEIDAHCGGLTVRPNLEFAHEVALAGRAGRALAAFKFDTPTISSQTAYQVKCLEMTRQR
jgi:hypothetical protein